jgi:hypothetical protein
MREKEMKHIVFEKRVGGAVDTSNIKKHKFCFDITHI